MPADGGGVVDGKQGAGKRDASMFTGDGEPQELGEIGRAEVVMSNHAAGKAARKAAPGVAQGARPPTT